MATTKTTEETFTGNGSTTTFPFTIEYEPTKTNNLKVFLGDALQTETTHYSISGTNLTFVTAPISGKSITIKRDTDVDGMMAAYSAGSSIRSLDLNNNHEQLLFHAQEIENRETNRFFTGTTPPTNPVAGAVWFEPVSGRSYVYYVDVDSGQWVESNPAFSVGDLSNVSLTGLTDTNIAGNADIEGTKLKDDTVTLAKLGSGALPTDITVNSSNLTADSVDSSELVNGSIDLSHMSANSIDSDQYVDGSIDSVHLASDVVTNVKVAGNAAIDAAKIEFQPPYPNSVARDLESKLANETFNVKDYGAKGDNSQDDKPAIQAAIDACGNTGNKVVFPPGLYRLDSSLTIGSSDHAIILEGLCGSTVGTDTYGARFTRAQGSTVSYITINEARSIEIRNLGFIGQGTGVKPTNGAIDVNAVPGTQEYIFENLYFHNISKCLNLDGLSSSIIRNCKFRQIPEDSGDVIAIHGGGTTTQNWQGGLKEDGSSNATAYTTSDKVKNGSAYYYCSQSGTSDGTTNATGPTGTGNNITDGTVKWNHLVISDRSDQIRITDCIVDGNNTTNERNQTVSGLSIDRDVNTVFVTNSSFIRLRYCIFINSTWFGDFLYFQNVEAERGYLDGFNINGYGNFITLDNCFSSSSNEQGINIGDVQNSSINITNPNIRDNKKHGILVNSPSIQNLSIVNPAIGGNSIGNTGNPDRFDNVYIANNVNNVSISGGKIGGTVRDLSGNGDAKYGVNVDGTSHKHIRIIGVNVDGNQTAGIHWSTGGINAQQASDNFIKYCPGYSDGQIQFP
tara:strand:- start:4404 stop:6776 length:2373 start_codon:yes stop_codon:yes gene_type:complete